MEDVKKGLQTVVNKAWDEPQFRSELVANPKSAIESATGIKVPADVDIVANDQTNEDIIYLNIPPKPSFDDLELTDEQLEQVAGGEVIVLTVMATVASVSITGISAISVGGAVNHGREKKGKKHW